MILVNQMEPTRRTSRKDRLLEVAIEAGREDVIDGMLPSIDDLDAPLAGPDRSRTALHLAAGAGTGIAEPARMTTSGLVRHLLRHMNGDRQAIAQLLPAAALDFSPSPF